jgi:hypothetical protein
MVADLSEPLPVQQDKITRLSVAAEKLRQAELEKKDLMERVEVIDETIKDLKTVELVVLMQDAGTDHWGLPDMGNLPSSDLVLKQWVAAKIPEGREAAAVAHLDEIGLGDTIKTEFRVSFGREELDKARAFEKKLVASNLDWDKKQGIHYQTLQATVREQMKVVAAEGRPPGSHLDREILGITEGRVAELVPRKEKKVARKNRT